MTTPRVCTITDVKKLALIIEIFRSTFQRNLLAEDSFPFFFQEASLQRMRSGIYRWYKDDLEQKKSALLYQLFQDGELTINLLKTETIWNWNKINGGNDPESMKIIQNMLN